LWQRIESFGGIMRKELVSFIDALDKRLNSYQKEKRDTWKIEDPSILRQRIIECLQEYNELIGDCCPHCRGLLNEDVQSNNICEATEKLEDAANNIMFLWCRNKGLL